VTAATPTIHRHEALHSTWLDADRGISVYLPPGYDEAAGRYPVLYLHDGQNLFHPDRAFIPGEHWRVSETADALVGRRLVQSLVIVGIDHGGPDRVAEFTPTLGGRAGGGRADRYSRFVIDEVMPFVAERYAIRTNGRGVGLGGSSLGGLVTLVMALRYPERFDRLMVMSPSVWWDGRVVLRMLHDQPIGPDVRIWLDVGRAEGRMTVRNTRVLRDALPGSHYVEEPLGDHSERSWARRFGDALEFLFGARPGDPAS
jgi:enterochelin esterase-like enzyme